MREIKNTVRITRSDPDEVVMIDPTVKPAKRYTRREQIAEAQEKKGYWMGRTDILVVNFADGGQDVVWATEEGFTGMDFRLVPEADQQWCREERERLLELRNDPQMKLFLIPM